MLDNKIVYFLMCLWNKVTAETVCLTHSGQFEVLLLPSLNKIYKLVQLVFIQILHFSPFQSYQIVLAFTEG